jgi:hypothetical protein
MTTLVIHRYNKAVDLGVFLVNFAVKINVRNPSQIRATNEVLYGCKQYFKI